MKKKPSTSELLDWIKLLVVEDIPPEALTSKDKKDIIPPLYGALLKNEQDVHCSNVWPFGAARKVTRWSVFVRSRAFWRCCWRRRRWPDR